MGARAERPPERYLAVKAKGSSADIQEGRSSTTVRGPRESSGFQEAFRAAPTPEDESINRRNRRRWATRKEKLKDDPGIRKIPDSSRNFEILPFLGDPWGPGGRSEGVPINTQRPTRK